MILKLKIEIKLKIENEKCKGVQVLDGANLYWIQSRAVVLATGGGAFMSQATRLLIKKTATSVWLRVSFEVLAKRLEKRSGRPLLQTVDPQQTLKELIKERYPIYNFADLIVDGENDGVDTTVSKVIECLADYCPSKQSV